MTALMDENRFQEALDVAEDLLEEDFLLNRRLFTRVLATAATKARRNGLAVKLLRKMRQNRVKPIVSGNAMQS